MKNQFFALVVAAALISACQTAKEAMIENGAILLTKEEASTRLSGNTQEFSSGAGAGYYAPDGSFAYKMNDGETGVGTWSVKDDGRTCMVVEDWWGKEERCWEIYREPDGSYYSISTNDGKKNGPAKVPVAGNQL